MGEPSTPPHAALPDPDAPVPNISPERGFTAQDLIDQQGRLESVATEAIPYRFDTCTYERGYIRQPVFACRTCGGGGVCAGCSVACHGDHELVELFNRRNFRCDCGTENLYRERKDRTHTGFPSDAEPCQLRKSGASGGFGAVNDSNKYDANFRGHFCVCERGQAYDAETEDETMFQCLLCENWLHESCVSLRPDRVKPPLLEHTDFDTMICGACAAGETALHPYIGVRGFIAIERVADVDTEDGTGRHTHEIRSIGPSKWALYGTQVPELHAKRRRTAGSGMCKRPTRMLPAVARGAQMDVYLQDGFRDVLCRCNSCEKDWARLPYVASEEETYEPPVEDDAETASVASTNSTYDRALAALGHLPRDRMIESLRAYEGLRDALFAHLRPFAEKHEPVDEDTVRSFFKDFIEKRSAQ